MGALRADADDWERRTRNTTFFTREENERNAARILMLRTAANWIARMSAEYRATDDPASS